MGGGGGITAASFKMWGWTRAGRERRTPSSMSCADGNLASLLLKLSGAHQVAAILGETIELKLQPWLLSSQKCEDMLRCRLPLLDNVL